MDAELIISGTPEGQDYYGRDQESRQYMSMMYTTPTDNKLMVDVRKENNGKAYCYYNYLVYKDVIGVGGRSGSYFCLSLRLDAYCTPIQSMYRLLDMTYHNYVKNKILKVEGNKVQYMAANFKDLAKEIKDIEDFVYSNFERSFKANDFPGLQGFQFNNGKVMQVNLYDYSDQSLMACVQKGTRLHVSPTFPTIQVQQVKEQYEKNWQANLKQLESAREADRVQRDKLESDLLSANREIVSLEAIKANLESENKDFKERYDKCQANLKELESAREADRVQRDKLKDNLSSANREIASLKVTKANLEMQNKDFKERYEKCQANLKQLESAREADRVQRDKLKDDLSSANCEIASLEATKANLESQNEDFKAQYEKCQANLKELESAREADRVQREKLKSDLSSANQEIASLEAAKANLELQNKDLEARLRTIGKDSDAEQKEKCTNSTHQPLDNAEETNSTHQSLHTLS